MCEWKKGPETGWLKADSNDASFIWLREISDFSRACKSTHFSETKQDTAGFPMRNFFFSADEKLGKKEASFQLLKQQRSQDLEVGERQRVLVQNNSEKVKS